MDWVGFEPTKSAEAHVTSTYLKKDIVNAIKASNSIGLVLQIVILAILISLTFTFWPRGHISAEQAVM
jgi:hypothetical protein